MTAHRFDAHCHIIDPRFTLKVPGDRLPIPFTVADYQSCTRPLGITGGAVVSCTAQGFNQGYLLDALRRLGPRFVGVTQLPPSVTDAELDTLSGFGVRGVRLNLWPGRPLLPDQVLAMALRVHRHVNWHTELAIDARDISDLEDCLVKFPALCLEHRVLDPRAPRRSLPTLLRLAERGVRIKVCGVQRRDVQLALTLKDLYAANPGCLMFGSNLPARDAGQPLEADELNVLADVLGDLAAHKVLWSNANHFYRL